MTRPAVNEMAPLRACEADAEHLGTELCIRNGLSSSNNRAQRFEDNALLSRGMPRKCRE